MPISQLIEKMKEYIPNISTWRMLDVYSALEKGLVISSSLMLTLAGIWGYSVYMGFMRKNPNTKKRLINVLNGQFALCEQLYGVVIFIATLRSQMGLGDESDLFLILLHVRSFLSLYFGLVQFLIAVMTLMKKFYPDDYLTMSEKWTLKASMRDTLIILIIHGLLMGTCKLTSQGYEDFLERVGLTYGLICLIILILTLWIQIRIVVAENKKTFQLRMNTMFKSNNVSPENENEVIEVDEAEIEDEEDKVSEK